MVVLPSEADASKLPKEPSFNIFIEDEFGILNADMKEHSDLEDFSKHSSSPKEKKPVKPAVPAQRKQSVKPNVAANLIAEEIKENVPDLEDPGNENVEDAKKPTASEIAQDISPKLPSRGSYPNLCRTYSQQLTWQHTR